MVIALLIIDTHHHGRIWGTLAPLGYEKTVLIFNVKKIMLKFEHF